MIDIVHEHTEHVYSILLVHVQKCTCILVHVHVHVLYVCMLLPLPLPRYSHSPVAADDGDTDIAILSMME